MSGREISTAKCATDCRSLPQQRVFQWLGTGREIEWRRWLSRTRSSSRCPANMLLHVLCSIVGVFHKPYELFVPVQNFQRIGKYVLLIRVSRCVRTIYFLSCRILTLQHIFFHAAYLPSTAVRFHATLVRRRRLWSLPRIHGVQQKNCSSSFASITRSGIIVIDCRAWALREKAFKWSNPHSTRIPSRLCSSASQCLVSRIFYEE